jgi:putrescine transport system substrate-binding protein
VTYLFGTTGIAYNVDAVAAAVPDAPVDSLAMIWDPAVVSKFADCGVAVLDSPSEVVGSVLSYLGKNPNSEKPEDLAAAEKVMLAVRPYIREISSDYVGKLVSGDICVGLDWSGDALQAMGRAFEERRPYVISYRVPREGSFIFLDTMAIPADASHVKNAHLFIDYMLRGDVAAKNSEFTNHANGNQASLAFIDSQVRSDENFFPSPEIQDKLVVDLPESQEFERQLRRTWTRFTGAKY